MRKHLVLQRLPQNLDRKQMLFLDGIRYSVETAETAYSRLRKTLLTLTNRSLEKKNLRIASLTTRAVLDAWVIIDSIHRLRGLLRQMPRVKQRAPYLVSFYKQTEKIEKLRNLVQHLNNEMDNLVLKKLPVWGTLNWVAIPGSVAGTYYSCSLTPGSLFGRVTPFVNPVGKDLQPPIDLIRLTAVESVNLSQLMDRVETIIALMEKQLRNQLKGLPLAGSDIFIILEIAPNPIPPTPPEQIL